MISCTGLLVNDTIPPTLKKKSHTNQIRETKSENNHHLSEVGHKMIIVPMGPTQCHVNMLSFQHSVNK